METKKQNSNVLAIIVMILLFGMISFVTNLASPMGDVLKNQFGVANWMGTLGVFANFIAYAVMGIPAGNMLQNMGYKKTAFHRRCDPDRFGIRRFVRRLPFGRVHRRLLDVYVEHRREPHAQQTRGRRQQG